MYGFPADLDFSPIVGEFTTQLCIGQFDVSFSLGSYRFVVQAPIALLRQGHETARWEPASWPPAEFFDLMNTPVVEATLANSRLLVLTFQNGLEAHLADDSDLYETMQIVVGANPSAVYIV